MDASPQRPKSSYDALTVRFEHADITKVLPQSHPMVLVDRVTAMDPGGSIVAIKAISGCELCYQGLESGVGARRYAYPASLLLESFGQTAALLWLTSQKMTSVGKDNLLVLAGVRGCRILESVFPGDVIRHRARLDAMGRDYVLVSGETFVGSRMVMHIDEMLAALRPMKVVCGEGTA